MSKFVSVDGERFDLEEIAAYYAYEEKVKGGTEYGIRVWFKGFLGEEDQFVYTTTSEKLRDAWLAYFDKYHNVSDLNNLIHAEDR